MGVIDSHCHLTFPQLRKQVDDVVSAAAQAGVDCMITIGTTVEDSQAAAELARSHDRVYSAVGVHPHDAGKVRADYINALDTLCDNNPIVAVGETGLDYHYDFADRTAQQEVFEAQLDLAARRNLPVIIHSREAEDDCLSIITGHTHDLRGVFHCYAGSPDQARAVLDAGLYISTGGVVTFKNADNIRDMLRVVPTDRLLLETDAPFLSPEPVRKQRPNQPAYIMHTLAFVADLLGVDRDELAARTSDNARTLFNLPG